MFEIPATKTTSFYFDTRVIAGLAPIVSGLSYSNAPDGAYRRVFTINLTFGCKFNMFSKKKFQDGMKKFEELKLENQIK